MSSRVERREIVIVGGGPAGAGTALALQRLAPALAAKALVLDRARFPRDKTCAGGLIPLTIDLLRRLDLSLSVPAVRVDQVHVEAGGPPIDLQSPGCCWVIRRREFDDMLLRAVGSRGTEVRTETAVRHVERVDDRIRLETTTGTIEARVVVAADGAGSLLRRSLVDPDEGWIARAVMCDVPTGGSTPPDRYEFDFRPVREGLAGYAWSFPCLIDGRPHWNVGVYSVRRRGEGRRLEQVLAGRCAGVPGRKAHPIRLYAPGRRLSAPGVLLVGDAAGVDPLLGEGISFALEYGHEAARAITAGFARGDVNFADYGARVEASPLGKKLRRLALGARLFYGPRSDFWFRAARLSRTAQRIGMNWYNGVGFWSPAVPPLPRVSSEAQTGHGRRAEEPAVELGG